MKQAILPACLLAVFLVVCLVGYQQAELSSQLAAVSQQADYAVACETGERVVQLPEDGEVYHTVLLLHADWRRRQQERELVAWFKTEPALVSISAQTHFWQITDDQPIYEANYKANVPTLPAVLVMTGEGQTVYKASGQNMPNPQTLAAELCGFFDKRPWLRLRPWLRPRPCPDGNCPKPTPDVDVDVDVAPAPIPDVRPVEPVDSGSDVWIVLAILGAISGVAALAWHIKHQK